MTGQRSECSGIELGFWVSFAFTRSSIAYLLSTLKTAESRSLRIVPIETLPAGRDIEKQTTTFTLQLHEILLSHRYDVTCIYCLADSPDDNIQQQTLPSDLRCWHLRLDPNFACDVTRGSACSQSWGCRNRCRTNSTK